MDALAHPMIALLAVINLLPPSQCHLPEHQFHHDLRPMPAWGATPSFDNYT